MLPTPGLLRPLRRAPNGGVEDCSAGKLTPAIGAFTPLVMHRIGWMLARYGNVVFDVRFQEDGELDLIPASTWTVRGGPSPRSWVYELTLQGPTTLEKVVRPAASVIHVRLPGKASSPWLGLSPIQSAVLTGQLQARLEQSLAYEAGGSTGSVIVVPEGSEPTTSFKENINDLKGGIGMPATTSGGDGDGSQSPRRDYQQSRIGPSPPMSLVGLRAQVELCIQSLFGVSPAITMGLSDGTAQRESWRRFLVGVIENLTALVKAEILLKLGLAVDIDMSSLRALDISGNSRAVGTMVAAGVDVQEALRIAGFSDAD